MCLYLNKEAEKQIATKDIVCYKRIVPNINPYKDKLFTGEICFCKCEGKIQVEGDRIYLCTDNEYLNGSDCKNKLGYKYSWLFDNNVKSIIIDGIELMNLTASLIFMTPYRYAEVQIGETYTSELIHEDDHVSIGLHSFTTYEAARRNGYGIVVKCIIPKGSEYYLGDFCGDPSYASNKLVYLKIIKK